MSAAAAPVFSSGKPHSSNTACACADVCVSLLNQPEAALSTHTHTCTECGALQQSSGVHPGGGIQIGSDLNSPLFDGNEANPTDAGMAAFVWLVHRGARS